MKFGIALLAAVLLAACDQSPKPPSTPPVPKTESGAAESKQQIFTHERQALERAKQVAPTVEDRERDMRERVERQER
ncbi:MAG TPA: hypothetical protein VLW45_07770 [Pelomicrobium sp.]|nr:hypothetical protein [Pelomicrobium sp.]